MYEELSTEQLVQQTGAARKFLRNVVEGPIKDIARDQIREMVHEIRIRRFIDWHNKMSIALGEEPRDPQQIRDALALLRNEGA